MKTETFDLTPFIAMQVDVLDILVTARAVNSRSEAKRLLNQRAVELDGEVITERVFFITDGSVLRVGKHFWRKLVFSEEQKESIRKYTATYYEFEPTERDECEKFLRTNPSLSEEYIQRVLKEDFDENKRGEKDV